MKRLALVVLSLGIFQCKENNLYGRYHSTADVSSVTYYVEILDDSTFVQHFEAPRYNYENKGRLRLISGVNYEFYGWKDIGEDTTKSFIENAEIYDGKIIFSEGFDEYNFEKSMFD